MSLVSFSEDDQSKNQSDSLSVFCREVRNLLRSKPNCMIPFSKFVPAYHNHYGRQCCVYQFGYTKLIELLESIPHVVQIVGDGTNRYITLTHREQIKRFASDLIKVVKSQPGKKLKLSQFARAYEQVLGRKFRVEDYGTNDINVLLAEIWEGTINIMPIKSEFCDFRKPLFVNPKSQLASMPGAAIVHPATNINKPYVTEQYPDAWFEIPKRERSDKEIRRTKYFVWDVIELLSNLGPDYSVPFSKFIPSYHYYFNRQCKVSIFGFSKLIDLFESISPEVVEIVDQGMGEEKIIKLARQHHPKPTAETNQHKTHTRPQPHHLNNKAKSSANSSAYGSATSSRSDRNKMTLVEELDGDGQEDDEEELEMEDEEIEVGMVEEEDDDEEVEVDEDEDVIADDEVIDDGPTEEELLELEEELEAYEEMKAMQKKRSGRMAAILDIFKYSVY